MSEGWGWPTLFPRPAETAPSLRVPAQGLEIHSQVADFTQDG